jgi:hypothetical protein
LLVQLKSQAIPHANLCGERYYQGKSSKNNETIETRSQAARRMADQAALNQGILQALQAITEQLQQAQANAAAAAAAAVAPGAAPGVAPDPVFAATPAKVNSDQIINYSTAQGIKLFNAATEKLPVTFEVRNCFVMPSLTEPTSQDGTLVKATSSPSKIPRKTIAT